MLLDVFNLLVDFAVKVAGQPDEHIEFLDKDLKDFFTNKEYADRFKNIVYPNEEAIKIPNSEAQKKLKQIVTFFYFLAEFEKYLNDRAADVREQKRQMLIAIAIFEMMLSHNAMVSEFWDTLSNQYIQYLADRLKMLEIMINLIPLYQKQAFLQQQIAVLDRRIKELDGEILRAENFLNTRYDELIKLSQARLDAVAKVTQDAMRDHLDVLALGTQDLANLVTMKREQLQKAEQELQNYEKNDPTDRAGKKSTYLTAVEKTEKELEQASNALGKYESRLQELHEKHESILNEVNQLKEKALSAKNLEEKKAISEQLLNDKIPELANFTRELPAEAKSLLSTVYGDLKGLAGVDTSMPERMSAQIKDFSPQLTKAVKKNSEEIGFKQTSIGKKTEELVANQSTRKQLHADLIEKQKQEEDVKNQIKSHHDKIEKFMPGFDFDKFKKDSLVMRTSSPELLHAKLAEPTPRNTSPKL